MRGFNREFSDYTMTDYTRVAVDLIIIIPSALYTYAGPAPPAL